MQFELSHAAGTRAGFWSRLAAVLVDGLIIVLVLRLLLLGLGFAGAWVALGLSIAYYVACEGSTGQTLGKRALRIRVVDIDSGGPIGYRRALTRYLVSVVSALALYIGYLWMLRDPEQQTWHDKLASAVVVPSA